MNIKCVAIEPNPKSLNYELIFKFNITDIKTNELIVNLSGELYSEDNYKLTNLDYRSNNIELSLNAGRSSQIRPNPNITVKLTAELSAKAISHIENYRLTHKEKTKDVDFNIKLIVGTLTSNIELSSIFAHGAAENQLSGGGQVLNVFYQYKQDFHSGHSDMWVLSANGSPKFLTYQDSLHEVDGHIEFMEWLNTFTKYFKIGEFLVYELLIPESTIFSKALKDRYEKAQHALKDMQTQLNYGEWKQAIIASRPIVELFNNFDDFKQFLMNHDYSEEGYNDLKKTINGFFDFLSKFYHALKKGNTDINPEIPAYKEDAHLVYSFSISLLYLISQKSKRKL